MNLSRETVIARIVEGRRGQLLSLADRSVSDLRVDRLIFGPGTAEDLRHSLLGWPANESAVLFDSGAHEVDPFLLAGLGAAEALYLPAQPQAHHRGGVRGLVDVVDRLLDPVGGCPWDLEQTHETLKKYLIEEAYELIEAIERGDETAMIEELGDVLLQPFMHTQIAMRRGAFDADEVGQRAAEKLVRRHPHVFGDVAVEDAAEVLRNWDAIKKQEKGGATSASLLDGVPVAMPALLRALNISKRAARAGFEWKSLEDVLAKLDEERAELAEALLAEDQRAIEGEIGDLLFTVVNVARWKKIDPEEALRKMLGRFTKRFQYMEETSGKPLRELSPEEWFALWMEAKSSSLRTSPQSE